MEINRNGIKTSRLILLENIFPKVGYLRSKRGSVKEAISLVDSTYRQAEWVEFATVNEDALAVKCETIFIPRYDIGIAVAISFNWSRCDSFIRGGKQVGGDEVGSHCEQREELHREARGW